MGTSLMRLRNSMRFTATGSRNRIRYIVEDTVADRYLRIGRREYLLAIAFNGHRDPQSAVECAVKSDPTLNWSESFIKQCMTWLIQNRVIEQVGGAETEKSPMPASTDPVRKAFDPLSFQIELLSGERIRRIVYPLAKAFTPAVWGLMAITVLWALLCLISNLATISAASSKLFVPEAKYWWLFAWLVLKIAHETGHATIAVRIGGAVRKAGVTFFCFAPIPFVDVTDVWRTARKRDRILCSIGGILAEVMLAAVAIIVFSNASSEVVRYATISIATLGTITTLAFNANPLMRYDGYFVVSDLVDKPNLWADSQLAYTTRVGAVLSGQVSSVQGSFALALYGIGTTAYRFLMLFGLAWGAVSVWQGLGWLVVAFAAYSWFISPKVRQYQRASSNLGLKALVNDKRRLIIGGITLTAAMTLIYFCPTPFKRYVPAVVTHEDPLDVRTKTEGIIAEYLCKDGDHVEVGQALLRLTNDVLEEELRDSQLQLKATDEKVAMLAARKQLGEMQKEIAQAQSLTKQVKLLQERVDGLIVRAGADGVFLSSNIDKNVGCLQTINQVVGIIVRSPKLEVEASVRQADIEYYRALVNASQAIAIYSDSGERFQGTIKKISPRAADEISNPIFAALYGGPVSVRLENGDSSEKKLIASEGRFNVRIELDNAACDVISVGQRCYCRPVATDETMFEYLSQWGQFFFKRINADQQKSST